MKVVLRRNKAVAIGAISYYVDHFVTARISKFTYGVPCSARYCSSNPEHVKREHKAYIDATGNKRVPGCFNTMLTKVRHSPSSPPTPRTQINYIALQGTKISKDREIRHSFCVLREGVPPQRASFVIMKYTGVVFSPKWEDEEPGKAFSFPLYPRSEPSRQVPNFVPCQGQHLQRTVYNRKHDGKNGLSARM